MHHAHVNNDRMHLDVACFNFAHPQTRGFGLQSAARQAEDMKQLIEELCQNIEIQIFAQQIFLNTTFLFFFESHFHVMSRMHQSCTCV